MWKLINSIILFFLISGCYQSTLTPMMVAGPAAGVAQGRAVSSLLSTGINYGVKQETGKFPYEHVFKREKAKIVKKVASIEKDVKKTSALVKDKVLDHKGALKIKDKVAKVRWVLGVKKIKTVTQEEAFAANKPRYSYWPNPK